MNRKFRLRFITPCFCAGANQLQAEVRPASIRGALRWWFRCVGGTVADEAAVLGSVAGRGTTSAIVVRVRDLQPSATPYAPTYKKLSDPGSYLHYFLAAATGERPSRLWQQLPDEKANRQGAPRQAAFFAPGTLFTLEILQVRRIEEVHMQILDRAIGALLAFGSLGYRHSRGFGAWVCEETRTELQDTKARFDALSPFGFTGEWAANAHDSDKAELALNQIEGKLKGNKESKSGLRFHHPAKTMTALGYSLPPRRQASAVFFRPVEFLTRAGQPKLALLTFQAPDSVLGPDVIEPRRIVPTSVALPR